MFQRIMAGPRATPSLFFRSVPQDSRQRSLKLGAVKAHASGG